VILDKGLACSVVELSAKLSSASDYSQWDQFVYEHQGSYCHLSGWQKIFEKTYGLRTLYLGVKNCGALEGIFPVAVISSLFGTKAVSLPFSNYGGLLVANPANHHLFTQLILSYLQVKGINFVEVRESPGSGSFILGSEVTFMLKLPECENQLWNAIGAKVRNQIRKAQRSSLEVSWDRNHSYELYELYANNMGRLGTPVHSHKFIEEILSVFDKRADILTIRIDKRAIAAMLVLKHGDTWIGPIAASRTEFSHLNPNMLLYWEGLRQATLARAVNFDFGRSKYKSGTYNFKKQWGAIEIPLDYHSYKKGVRVQSASTDLYRSDKAAIFARCWACLPGSVQNWLGPKIRPYIP